MLHRVGNACCWHVHWGGYNRGGWCSNGGSSTSWGVWDVGSVTAWDGGRCGSSSRSSTNVVIVIESSSSFSGNLDGEWKSKKL